MVTFPVGLDSDVSRRVKYIRVPTFLILFLPRNIYLLLYFSYFLLVLRLFSLFFFQPKYLHTNKLEIQSPRVKRYTCPRFESLSHRLELQSEFQYYLFKYALYSVSLKFELRGTK